MNAKHTRLEVLAGIAALIAAALVPATARAQDAAPSVPTGQFGLMGAVRGEIVRLNISNIRTSPPDPCRATLLFVDVNGNPLVRPDGNQVVRQVVLGAGQSAFLQFNAGPFLGRDEVRVNFRPVVLVPPDPNAPPDPNVPPDPYVPPDPNAPCVPTLEIIDGATGQARLLIAGGPGIGALHSASTQK